MSNPMKPFLSVAAGLVIGLLIGSASSPGAEASARAVPAPALTATLPQRADTVPCHHEEPSVWVSCDWFFADSAIRSVTLNVTTNANREYRMYIRTGRPDAIFLTKDAALRFLAPYYCCTAGRVELLDRLRETVSRAETIRTR
jgi:hypothetical protein